MAETLSELVVKITADAAELKKALGESEKDLQKTGKSLEKETKSWREQFKAVGKLALGMGAAITAAMTGVIMSFTKTGSELNDLSLKTGVSIKALVGLKYAAEQNGASLGTVEMAIRRASSALIDVKEGSTEAIRAFDRMGISVKDLEGLNVEEQFLKIATAIAEIPDPMTRSATAVDLFGRSGTDMLPMLSEGAEGLRKMMEEGVKLTGWTDKGAKSADAFGDAVGTLQTSMTGIFNVIGESLSPALKSIADAFTGIIGKIKDWMTAHPQLVKALGTAAIACGILATAFGLISLAVIYLGTTINLYFGGILLIIGALVTGIVLLIDWFNRAGVATKKLADENKAVYEKTLNDIKTYYTQKKTIAENDYKSAVDNIRKEYGILESTIKNKMDLAKDASDANKRALEDELKQAQRIHNEKIALLEKEYNQRIKTLNAEADYEIQQIQAQINALDEQTRSENLILTRADEAKRLTELKAAINSAATAEDLAEAKINYEEYITEVARNELLRQRDAEKETLRARIEDIRTTAETETDRLEKELESNKLQEDNLWILTETRLTKEKDALDTALEAELKRLDKERLAKEETESFKLAATMLTLTREETAITSSLKARLAEATTYQTDLESIIRDITQTITTTYVTVQAGGGVATKIYTAEEKAVAEEKATAEKFNVGLAWRGYQHGGIVSQPTLAMIGEAGPEAVIPLNEAMGGITINFTQPVFFDREDTMNKFVDMIRKGIQRQDRIRFGGAYSG